jgi:NAD(P)-dependent dehydrogenase (short-subunit alcohol dehydrogenase family)
LTKEAVSRVQEFCRLSKSQPTKIKAIKVMSKLAKTILITGASTGFGRDTAETLTRQGYIVFASFRDITVRNKSHAEALRSAGINVVELDVTNNDSVETGVSNVLSQAGRIDVLVNNAGIAFAGVSEAFTVEQVRNLFEVNVFGIQRVLRAVLPTLRKQRDGLVINVGSILGRVTFPFFGLYGASKYAVEALTDSYRYELSQLGVDVLLVQPSAYPTNMYASAQQPADKARSEAYGEIGAIPGKMFGTFQEIFRSKTAPSPHDVPEAIAKLVGQTKGARPARVVVGEPYKSDVVNLSVEPVQAQVIDGLGLGQLANIRSSL